MKRLWDILAPERPAVGDRGYRRLLRWAALPVTDRRWAAPLCAAALGFGLFAGVAISPGTSGSDAAPILALQPTAAPVSEEPAAEAPEEEALEEEAGGEELEEEFPVEEESFESFPEEEFSEETFEEEPFEEEELPDEEENEPEEETQVVRGLVVHTNPAAGSYTLVEAGGLLSAVHATKLPTVGTKVEVPVRTLANGTSAEAGTRKRTGTTTATSLTGIVTFVDPDPAAPAYAVSKRGSSVLVRVHPDPTGVVPPLPALGAYATVEVDVEVPPAPPVPVAPPATPAPVPPPPSCAPDPSLPAAPLPAAVLWQRTIDADGAPFASSDVAGVVLGICPGQLLLSGDDARETSKGTVVTVPGSIKLGKVAVGDSVLGMVEIEPGGGLKLTGLASDERTKGADDAKATQGELVPQVAE
ncbi:MAG TPA: hypothetical protein VFX45_09960 [Solirubrobacterales bacterium]|nr:hypothetical protein [Solirubrobacterales bacterium]